MSLNSFKFQIKDGMLYKMEQKITQKYSGISQSYTQSLTFSDYGTTIIAEPQWVTDYIAEQSI